MIVAASSILKSKCSASPVSFHQPFILPRSGTRLLLQLFYFLASGHSSQTQFFVVLLHSSPLDQRIKPRMMNDACIVLFVAVPPKCKNLTLDLTIVLETSSELGPQHFLSAKEFIDKLLHFFDVSPGGTHVSLLVYNRIVHSVMSFDNAYYQNRNALEFMLQYLPPFYLFLSGPGHLDKALRYVNDNVFTAVRGDRPEAQNVAVFLTDGSIKEGKSPNDISGIVSSLKVKMGDLRLEYKYEIEYEYDFSSLECILKIIAWHSNI